MVELRRLMLASVLLRLVMVLYGAIQDRWAAVPYTDIDYTVFTDAARYVAAGESPYLRSTYRYSPLLAYMLLPNIWISSLWGKVLFSALDVWVGLGAAQLVGAIGGSSRAAKIAACVWWFNPYTLSISTRGSCDVIIVALLLAILFMLLHGYASSAAVLYGLAVHMRIYPIIYAPSIVLFLAARSQARQAIRKALKDGQKPSETAAANAPGLSWPKNKAQLEDLGLHVILHGLIFGLISGGIFFLLGWIFNALYGQAFVQEAFLHHVTRKDPRHNFSPYFYTLYLTYFNAPQVSEPDLIHTLTDLAAQLPTTDTLLAANTQTDPMSQIINQLLTVSATIIDKVMQPSTLVFLPQAVVLLALACRLHAHLPLCWLTQTLAFVALNKVSTAQYFVWWLWLIPVIMHCIPHKVPLGVIIAAGMWVATQLHWLFWAYQLEFKGQPVFLLVWIASILFLAANIFLLVQLLLHVQPQTSFLAYSLTSRGHMAGKPASCTTHAAGGTASADATEQPNDGKLIDNVKSSKQGQASSSRIRSGRQLQ